MVSKTIKSHITRQQKQIINHTKTNYSKYPRKIAKKVINIIAYNISWESMSGKKPEWELCSNNNDPSHPRHHSVCANNIASVLEDNPADFILLQEAENYNHLIEQSSRLAKMNYKIHESGKDRIITFWNKKYKLLKVISGEFELGRPWMAILYTNGWCVINVHFGHYSKEQEINKLNQLVRKIKKEFVGSVNVEQSENKNKCKRLIIGGDFNYDIKKFGRDGKMNLDSVAFYYHPKNLLTCCINRRVQNDHVIDTQAPLLDIKIPNVAYMASDHKPIIATMQY